MLETFTVDTFSDRIGESFRLVPAGAPAVELRLSRCDPTPFGSAEEHERSGRRVPFSLLFHAPAEVRLPQAIYPLEHEELGALEVFLVPLGADGEGTRYEAVFA